MYLTSAYMMNSLIGMITVLLGIVFVPAIAMKRCHKDASCVATKQEVVRLTAENQALKQELDRCVARQETNAECIEDLRVCRNQLNETTSELTTCKGELLSFTSIQTGFQECNINTGASQCRADGCFWGCYDLALRELYNISNVP
ncbi:uncharacterized protein [Mytilus edulis]|uniref:uncharacterized protein n=1 Tax=Mytilus edulis TaxID=6550 RepID=UPI0039F0E4CD